MRGVSRLIIAAALCKQLALAAAAAGCATSLDCSLNGVCTTAGVCQCDAPWRGPVCGVLGYKTTPASGRSLYPTSDPRNTWNGAIMQGTDGVYHLYNPLYPAGSLGGTTTLLHGTARNVTGPYQWGVQPDITIPLLGAFDGPKSVVYTEASDGTGDGTGDGNGNGTGTTRYSLWLGGRVYVAGDAAGPFRAVEQFQYPGHNPAPVWHNGSFYTIDSMTAGIYTTPRLAPGAKWTHHADIDSTGVPAGWIPEDPDMWVDRRGNWHIVNHAYDPHEWQNCSKSVLSSHFFSGDGGRTWHFLPEAVQPYSHTVSYDDGTSHMFITMERPNLFFDGRGQLTHIHLAADGVTGDEGCGNRTEHAHYGHTPCDNCKYADHGSTTIIALGV